MVSNTATQPASAPRTSPTATAQLVRGPSRRSTGVVEIGSTGLEIMNKQRREEK